MDITEIEKKLSEAHSRRDESFEWLGETMNYEQIDAIQGLIQAWIDITMLNAAKKSALKGKCPKCGGDHIKGMMLMSDPPQVKCSKCGNTWSVEEQD